jgi:hypothetical protein
MNMTHSSGLTSVPVAIMSTVTAMRMAGLVRNAFRWPFGSFAGVGDLRGEVVPLAEHFAHGLHDLLGVVVVLGEDQRLRHGMSSREDLGEEPVAEGLQHESDLMFRRHRPIDWPGV